MANEIERKFLVLKSLDIETLGAPLQITQGYLNSDKERSVRVRIKNEQGFITVKGIGNDSGTTRYEFEKEIPIYDAQDLLKICEPGVIEKIRREIVLGDHTFEVDFFSGDNKGLIVAEIELQSEDESFEKPSWLGEEVTGHHKYYNSMLAKKPFSKW